MAQRPVFVATHPRACSTAFERVFMTSRDRLKCVHEPFGDAFYFGPERLGTRYEDDEKARLESGFSESTYKIIFDKIMEGNAEGKRIFIKDITHYLVPPEGKPASTAPSLQRVKRGVGTEISQTNGDQRKSIASPTDCAFSVANGNQTKGQYPYPTTAEPGNPTVLPTRTLEQFHFAFLIRHPRHSIPSYLRCTIPPLDKITGFFNFMPAEAGYDELRRVFDYLKDSGIVGPKIAGQETNGHANGTVNGHNPNQIEICVVDADDMLDNPQVIMRKFCESVGIEFDRAMLSWDTPEDHQFARDAFEKWKGFHEDAINSTGLHAREHKIEHQTLEQDYEQWVKKYGEEAAKVIQATVEKNVADYEYLKQFAIKP